MHGVGDDEDVKKDQKKEKEKRKKELEQAKKVCVYMSDICFPS